jgi:DNA (cytosine-5)-methyltransferase 1
MVVASKPKKGEKEKRHLEKIGVVELFAGIAGLAQGFLRTEKFDLLALSDIDEVAKSVFEHNYPGPKYIRSDIHDLKPKHIFGAADGRKIAGLLGGPPCQGFSLAGKRNPQDARNLYVEDYLRFVRYLEPDFLLMENVPQLLFHDMFTLLRTRLSKNYVMRFAVLNSALFGAPQTRHRAFILGYHRRLSTTPEFPTPTHGFVKKPVYNYHRKRIEPPGNGATAEILGADPVVARMPELLTIEGNFSGNLTPLVTVSDAIGDLRGLSSGGRAKEYFGEALTQYQRDARADAQGILFNHEARTHTDEMLELIKKIPMGGDLNDIGKEYWPKSHYSQAYGRLHEAGLARTITTHFCNPGSGRFVHQADDRTITVREAARLQGFSDDFELLFSQSDQMRLIGNAVPVPLAKALATQIWAQIGNLVSK